MASRFYLALAAAGLCVVVTAAAATGLSGRDDDDVLGNVRTPGPVSDAATLRFVIWDENQQDSQQSLIDLFESRHPQINVELEVIDFATYWDTLSNAAAGQASIDIAWMNAPNFWAFAESNSLLSLDASVAARSINVEAFPPRLIDMYTHDETLYGVSKDMDTIGLYYNRSLFDAAGLDYPTEDWAWQDLRDAAEALTDEDTWGFGAAADTQTNLFPVILQNGGQILSADGRTVTVDTPEACEAIEWLYDFQRDGLGPHQTELDFNNQRDLFMSGHIAMIFDGSWRAASLASSGISVGVAPLPQGERRANIVHGLAWVAMSSTDHPEEATRFLEFLSSHEAHLIQAQSGAVMSSRMETQQDWLDNFSDPFEATVFIDELAVAVSYPTSPAPSTWATVLRTALRDGFHGDIDFPEACDLAANAGTIFISDALTGDNR